MLPPYLCCLAYSVKNGFPILSYLPRNAKKTETKVENIKEEMKETAENLEKFESEFKKIEEEATKVLEGYQKSQVREVGIAQRNYNTHTACPVRPYSGNTSKIRTPQDKDKLLRSAKAVFPQFISLINVTISQWRPICNSSVHKYEK